MNTTEDVKICDLCGSNEFNFIKSFQSNEWNPVKSYYENIRERTPFSFLPSKFNLISCKKCSLVFVTPRIIDEVVTRFYDEYLSGKYSSNILLYDSDHREKVFMSYLDLIKTHLPTNSKNFLDVGCASGRFLKVANRNGFNCFGIEVSESAGQLAKEYGKIFIGDVERKVEELENDFFDLVSLIDSLEHFRSPKKVLLSLYSKIKKGGILLIEVPNYHAGVDEMSRHFYLFTKETISLYLKMCNLFPVVLEETNTQYNSTDSEVKGRFLISISKKWRQNET